MSEFDGFVREFSRLTNKVKVWCEEKEIVEKLLHPTYGFELKNTESPKVCGFFLSISYSNFLIL